MLTTIGEIAVAHPSPACLVRQTISTGASNTRIAKPARATELAPWPVLQARADVVAAVRIHPPPIAKTGTAIARIQLTIDTLRRTYPPRLLLSFSNRIPVKNDNSVGRTPRAAGHGVNLVRMKAQALPHSESRRRRLLLPCWPVVSWSYPAMLHVFGTLLSWRMRWRSFSRRFIPPSAHVPNQLH
jgi:hypothetical protein